jgi:hypothetical protein
MLVADAQLVDLGTQRPAMARDIVVAAAGRKAASWTSLTRLEGITQPKQV